MLRARVGHLRAKLYTAIISARRAARPYWPPPKGLQVFEFRQKRIKQSTVGRAEPQRSVAFMGACCLLTETPMPTPQTRWRSLLLICADEAAARGLREEGKYYLAGHLNCAGSADEFANALDCRKNALRKKGGRHGLKISCFFSKHEPVYTIGRTPDRSSCPPKHGLAVAS